MILKRALPMMVAVSLLVLLVDRPTEAQGRDDGSRRGRSCRPDEICERLGTLEQGVADGFAAVEQETTAIKGQLDELLLPGRWVVQAVAVQGEASPGNLDPFYLLVVVNDARTGAPVTTLTQASLTVVSHGSGPGVPCGFTNQVRYFGNIGTGTYQIRMGLNPAIPGCAWVAGEYLGQVRSAYGQAVFKVAIQ